MLEMYGARAFCNYVRPHDLTVVLYLLQLAPGKDAVVARIFFFSIIDASVLESLQNNEDKNILSMVYKQCESLGLSVGVG